MAIAHTIGVAVGEAVGVAGDGDTVAVGDAVGSAVVAVAVGGVGEVRNSVGVGLGRGRLVVVMKMTTDGCTVAVAIVAVGGMLVVAGRVVTVGSKVLTTVGTGFVGVCVFPTATGMVGEPSI